MFFEKGIEAVVFEEEVNVDFNSDCVVRLVRIEEELDLGGRPRRIGGSPFEIGDDEIVMG